MSAKPLQLGTTNTGSLSFQYFATALGSRTFPFLLVVINHPTTPPPHVMLHQPRFWRCWVLGRRTEQEVRQHAARQSLRKGEKQKRKNYLHSSHPPPFLYFQPLYFLPYNVFFFKIRRLTVPVVCDKQQQAWTYASSSYISIDFLLYMFTTQKQQFQGTGKNKCEAVCAILSHNLPRLFTEKHATSHSVLSCYSQHKYYVHRLN